MFPKLLCTDPSAVGGGDGTQVIKDIEDTSHCFVWVPIFVHFHFTLCIISRLGHVNLMMPSALLGLLPALRLLIMLCGH